MKTTSDSVKENMTSTEAIEKLKELAEKCRTSIFITGLTELPLQSRPMSLQSVNEKGELVYISSSESEKNKAIARDSRVHLYFQNNSNSEFLSVYGQCSIHTDKATIDEYWTDFAKAWFTGKDDPTITILKVKPVDCYYWDNKSGKTIAFLKMAIAAFTPLEMNDDGIEGKLKI